MTEVKCIRVVTSAKPFDRDKANNGGSYYQPRITISGDFGDVYIEDDSCGDFGSDIFCKVEIGGIVLSANWGSLVYDQFSNFEESDMDIIDLVRILTGYKIPLRTEVEE